MLSKRYEINKIVREDKQSKEKMVIYMSEEARNREKSGIIKMLEGEGIETDDTLVTYIQRLNVMFGEYHTMDMLNNAGQLIERSRSKQDETFIKDFIGLWEKRAGRKL